jgi:poly(A) polymerase
LNPSRQFAIEVVQRLRDGGFEALWAGGCVRDLIMGHEPHDFDVATSATPDQVRGLFGVRRTRMVGACFGVIIVLSQHRDQQQVEVATFRTDASYSDGRRPDSVVFSTAEKDAQRRDFTINGMFFDPLTNQVIDYVGGRADLDQKLIRAIGDPHARLSEDKLRMLRAVRFAARFQFLIEPNTYAAIKAHASDVRIVSGERIAVELKKTLMTDQAAWAMDTCLQLGLMDVVAPEIADAWPNCHQATMDLLRVNDSSNWIVRMASLYWPLTESLDHAPSKLIAAWSQLLKERLKLSNEECDGFCFSLESQRLLEQAPHVAWSKIQPLFITPHARSGIELLRIRARLNASLTPPAEWLSTKLSMPLEELNPPPLIDGRDLHDLGLAAGPRFKIILQQARDLQLDGQLKNRHQAIDWLKRLGAA